MKKFKLVVVAFLMVLLGMPHVYAECDAAEANKLSSLANNVQGSQEVVEKEVDPDADWNPPDGLSEEEYDLISNSSNSDTQFKFKIVEVLQNFSISGIFM